MKFDTTTGPVRAVQFALKISISENVCRTGAQMHTGSR